MVLLDKSDTPDFAPLNCAFNTVFRPGRLSIGLVVPLETDRNDSVPSMTGNDDGLMTYPRGTAAQARVVADCRARVAGAGLSDKPVMQSLYVDLVGQPDAPPGPIHPALAQTPITCARNLPRRSVPP